MKRFATAVLLLLVPAMAAAESADPAGLRKSTGVNGGLALDIGAKDTALPQALAGGSALYVQVLQPDVVLAARWGADLSAGELREQLGVRSAAFNADDYGSNLFNLVVVEDPAALGKATLADLVRILVPRGWLACVAAPAALADEAKKLGLAVEPAAGFALLCRKPAEPVGWKICDNLKWRGGPRGANASAFSGIAVGSGKLFYRERMEVDGDFSPSGRSQFFARDAYNGRVAWSFEETLGFNPGWGANFAPRQKGMAADEKGRLFTTTADGKFVCLDAETGKHKFDLIPANVNAKVGIAVRGVQVYNNELVLAGGSAFSADDGRKLWSFDDGGYQIVGERMFIRSGRWGEQIEARSLPDGKVLWTHPCPRGQGIGLLCTSTRTCIVQTRPTVSLTALDASTGQEVWSYTPEGDERTGHGFTVSGDKIYVHYSKKGVKQDYFFTRLSPADGKVEQDDFGAPGKMWAGGCWGPFVVGDYMVYHHNIWLDLKTLTRTFPYLAHPACFTGQTPGYNMLYNFPSRKGGVLEGITAIAAADMAFDHEPGGKVLVKLGDAQTDAAPTQPGDWPMFRASPARGNAVDADPGDAPARKWEAKIGLGKATFGVMSGQRTGVTQPVCAYGLAVVADIDAQRIVALDQATGATRWTYAVGSRVDFPPTLYNGLCLFAAKDGWVYCLNARTGAPAWKLLIAPSPRLVGGQEKLESQWPSAGDVLIADGVGYASVGIGSSLMGGIRAVAFKPATGEVIWARCYHGQLSEIQDRQLRNGMFVWAGGKAPVQAGSLTLDRATGEQTRGGGGVGVLNPEAMDDYLAYGDSVCRTNEDRAADLLEDGRLRGRTLAFSKDIAVAYTMSWGGESWDAKSNRGIPTTLTLSAAREPKKTLWTSEPIELVVDDIVLTPKRAYCVGHHQRIAKPPEMWIVSPEDGKVVATVAIDGFPSFNGMSACGNRLFVSTRDGRVICYEGK
ncbi:MAG: Outer membrane protein assembly factor BamB [Phycisphaerae bacterium]|nr:Outer membrane protein assembly factor BamB [Phycisphaerae bacterium]